MAQGSAMDCNEQKTVFSQAYQPTNHRKTSVVQLLGDHRISVLHKALWRRSKFAPQVQINA
jgi:hypothetical protein